MLEPMLASLADAPLQDPQLVYEPKYDGIRVVAEVTTGAVRLWSRLGNEKTSQFPEVAGALGAWSRKRKISAIVDGELVALDAAGQPAGFQNLQGRIHLAAGPTARFPRRPARSAASPASAAVPTAFIAFDLLREGARDLRSLPLTERRARLERLFRGAGPPVLRLSEQVRADGRALYQRALESGWEGLIAKHADSRYQSGKRTPDWRKLKIVCEQEFVVGGWTEPRQTREGFGALLLGVYETSSASPAAAIGDLVYVGHVGTGFNERELSRLMKLLRPLEIRNSPFRQTPPSNERPHWVTPELVAQVKFTEWTADRKLRHPVYLGLRDDKKAADVRREAQTRIHKTVGSRLKPDPEGVGRPGPAASAGIRAAAPRSRTARPAGPRSASAGSAAARSAAESGAVANAERLTPDDVASVIAQLRALEDARRDGPIELPGGARLSVTNLHKIFWPKQKITKGDLFRYYAEVSPFILPAVADRPLVMKRLPNGIAGQTFYQHRATDVPGGIRTQLVEVVDRRPHLIGGDLITLLYMTQLASISQDPWFSRVGSPASVDHVALDLDPMPGVPFDRVLDVARWIRDELQTMGVAGFPKTSGADGLHVYIPMPPGTPYEAGLLFCQIVATVVATRHPKQATIERTVRARGPRVYVDYLQNILGKTLATAYSARASEFAGVSTPLTWAEVEAGVRREDFTLKTAPARFKQVGDLWAGLLKAKGVDLSRAARLAERPGGGKAERPGGGKSAEATSRRRTKGRGRQAKGRG